MGTAIPAVLDAAWLEGWSHEILHGKCLANSKENISTGRTSWGPFLHTLPLARLAPLVLQEWMFPQTKALKTPGGHHNSTPTLPHPWHSHRCRARDILSPPCQPLHTLTAQTLLFGPKTKGLLPFSYNVNCPYPGLPSTGLHDLNTGYLCISSLLGRQGDLIRPLQNLSPCVAWELGPLPPLHPPTFHQAHSEQNPLLSPAPGTQGRTGRNPGFTRIHMYHSHVLACNSLHPQYHHETLTAVPRWSLVAQTALDWESAL